MNEPIKEHELLEFIVWTPIKGEEWTCDKHVEPITYTDGTTECYCGNKK